MSLEHYYVRADHEWGEFFVREHAPGELYGSSKHAATWACVTSYGTFGCWWSHMGQPFAEFIKSMDGDYLLSKISSKKFSQDTCTSSVIAEIEEAHQEGRITDDQKENAMDAVYAAEDDFSGEAVASELYHDPRLDCVHIEWTELSTQVWPSDAEQFVKKLWPEFVKAVVERAKTEQVNP